MDNKAISSWIRQSRYRAKKQNINSNVEIADIQEILKEHTSCAYCEENHIETLDHPFPLKDSIGNIPANILPVCRPCKQTKKNNDLVWMYTTNMITKEKYLKLLGVLFSRSGGNILKEYVRKISGYGDDN